MLFRSQAVRVFGESYFGIISAILTILILVFSEIIPKTIGATYWRTLALPTAGVLRMMIFICYPLVWLSELITRLLTPKHSDVSISREEVTAMVDVGTKEGVFQLKESLVIQNLIKLESINVSSVMTPRIVTVIADESENLREFYKDKSFRPYSRIPLYDGDNDVITGYVLSMDVLEGLADDKFETALRDIKRSIMAVSENETVYSAWEKMLEHKEHIVLVVNEYGSFEGIITMEDIVETILGLEIIDEKDAVVDMQQFAREKWQARMSRYKHLSNKD